ncbi:MAG TPA: isoprenylcysteine carboxylmethyltransferase family protein [Rhizomicrobium sp.]|nr:isoprenylcysteine carboxylmethyltransferase family protein [Rhizomicrobium sp.]
MDPQLWIYAPWVVWAATWSAAALWANRTVAGPGVARQAPYRLFTTAGFALLLVVVAGKDGIALPASLSFLFARVWTVPVAVQWAMVALASLGFVFCWWARLHLGALWSGRITRKEGHKVVDTGPYALVRHPIYTGLLTGGLATMILRGSVHVILGFVLLVVGYWMKARLEERFLREQLGAADYDAYAARVPMLVPFAPA